jgi:hypothetical protein
MFKKGGSSPNPGGRRKGTAKYFVDGVMEALGFSKEDLDDSAKYAIFCSKAADRLAKIAFKGKNEKVALSALGELLDRILGKAVQPSITMEVAPNGIAERISDPLKRAEFARIAEQFSALCIEPRNDGDVLLQGIVETPRPLESHPPIPVGRSSIQDQKADDLPPAEAREERAG